MVYTHYPNLQITTLECVLLHVWRKHVHSLLLILCNAAEAYGADQEAPVSLVP